MDWLPSPEYFLNTSDFWVPSLFVITFRKVFRSIRIFGILEYFGPMPASYFMELSRRCMIIRKTND